MSSFDWKKAIKDGLIITAATIWIFFALKVASVKPTKVSLDAMNIMKPTGRICGGVLGKVYAVYNKCIKEWYNKNVLAPKGNKTTF